jgi:hypothetical protein
MALVDGMTAAEIRAHVIAATAHMLASANVQRRRPGIARGGLLLRRRRWIIADTTEPGVLVVAHLDRDGVAMYVGPAASMRAVVPRTVRLAWLAEQYGETDDDPTDAPPPAAPDRLARASPPSP